MAVDSGVLTSELPGDCGVANSWEAKADIRRAVPAGYVMVLGQLDRTCSCPLGH